MNNPYYDLKIEVAILQEEINAFTPRMAKFTIPALMSENNVGVYSSSNANIVNKRNGNLGASSIHMQNTVSLYVPYSSIFDYGEEKIPKETKFMIVFIGGNINDAKIIGRYNQSTDHLVSALCDHITEVINLDEREQGIINHADVGDNAIREYIGMEIIRIDGDIVNSVSNLSQTINTLRDTVNGTISTLRSDLEGNIGDLRTEMTGKINDDIGSLRTEFNGNISTARTALEDSIASVNTTLSGRISANDQADTEYRRVNDANITSIRGDIMACQQEAANIRTLIGTTRDELLQADEDLRTEVTEYADGINSTLNTTLRGVITNTASTTLSSANDYTDTEIDSLRTEVTGGYQAADNVVRQEFAAADTAIREAITNGDNAVRGEFAAADNVVRGEFAAADTVLRGEFTTADNVVRQEFAAADATLRTLITEGDSAVRREFAAADTAIRTSVTDGDNAVRREFANGDTAVRSEFAAADRALEGRISQRLVDLESSFGDETSSIREDMLKADAELDQKITDTENDILDLITNEVIPQVNTYTDIQVRAAKQEAETGLLNEVAARDAAIDQVREAMSDQHEALVQSISDTRESMQSIVNGVKQECDLSMQSLKEQLQRETKEKTDALNKKIDDSTGELAKQVQVQLAQVSVEAQEMSEGVRDSLTEALSRDVKNINDNITVVKQDLETQIDAVNDSIDEKVEVARAGLHTEIGTLEETMRNMFENLEALVQGNFIFTWNRSNLFFRKFIITKNILEARLDEIKSDFNLHNHIGVHGPTGGPSTYVGDNSNVSWDSISDKLTNEDGD